MNFMLLYYTIFYIRVFMTKITEHKTECGQATTYELEKGILYCEAEGITEKTGIDLAIKIIKDYSKEKKIPVKWLIEMSRLIEVNPLHRQYSVNFFKKDCPLEKLAILNPNDFFKQFFKQLSLAIENNCKIDIFENKEEAIEWLKK